MQIKTKKLDILTETRLTFPWPVGNGALRPFCFCFISTGLWQCYLCLTETGHWTKFITLQLDSLLVTATPPIIAFYMRWDELHYL